MPCTNKPLHILIISMLIFIVINIIENIIYFNSGKYGLNQDFTNYFTMPTFKELTHLIFIMLIFAFAQGFFTMLFYEY